MPVRTINRFIIIFTMIMGLPSLASAQTDYRVVGITFSGNFTIPRAQLLPLCSLKPEKKSILVKSDRPVVTFSPLLLEQDIVQLTRFYQREGFLHAQVRAGDAEVNDKKRTVKLAIMIQEGLPIRVAEIRLHVINAADSTRLSSLLEKGINSFKLQPDQRFRDALYRADLDRLQSLLTNNGFPYATIQPRLQIDESNNTVVINLEVQSGPQCRFGDISIQGHVHTREQILRRQVDFRQGEIFNKERLDKLQQQLYGLNLFEYVTVKALAPPTPQVDIPVNIAVREAERFSTKLGIGYGNEDRFRSLVQFQWLGFMHDAKRLNLDVKHSYLEPVRVDLQLTQPALLGSRTALSLNPFFRRQLEPGFHLNRVGSHISFQRSIGDPTKAGLTYTYENVLLDTASVAKPSGIDSLDNLYNKSSLYFGFSFDTTDDLFAPRAGINASFSIKYNGLATHQYPYLKWIVDLRRFQSWLGTVAAVRLSFGHINSFDPSGFIPVEDLFFAGGANSVRGWNRHELGPQDDKGKPLGGSRFVEVSVENRFPIWRIVNGAVFVDAGNVWVPESVLDIDELRYAVGIGLRIKTPIGPIRFDIAKPVRDRQNDYRWHLSIGEAF